GLSNDFKGDAFYELAASYRKTWLNSLGAEWRTDLKLGQTTSVVSEFYQPLDTQQRFFVAPRVEFQRSTVDLFQGDQRIASYNLRYVRAAIDLGTQFTRSGELRVGILGGTLDPTLNTGPPDLTPATGRIRQGAFTSRLIFDQVDSATFPRDGAAGSAHLFASSSALGATAAYNKWDADALGAWSFGANTLSVGLKAGGKLGNEPLP